MGSGIQFASDAAAELASEKGVTLEQIGTGSGSGGNVTKADVEAYEGEPKLKPGEPAATAGPPASGANEAPGTGVPGPADMELGGAPIVDPPGLDPRGAESKGDALEMRERDHQEDCPATRVVDGEEVSSVESFTVLKPPVKDGDGGVVVRAHDVRVARCVECGGQRVDDPLAEEAKAAA